ncbi:MAG TPA: rifamycin-inactivating phosphotransferase [Thermomicrobiales bacterium]|jgi:pyruvate,water dikinase|nr:rifamycin-inactivating phosphotransferase [Thermomicrobiales bacterium]
MSDYVLDLGEIDRTMVAAVGGKGANLGELSRIDGVSVPGGFCVTTTAFQRSVADAPTLTNLLDRLAHLTASDADAIRALSDEIRRTIEGIAMPDNLVEAIGDALTWHGGHEPRAVRSSATMEDAPTTSFAGQQDSWLNVSGRAAILRHISRCWASLFTERAVTYRLRNRMDHRAISMAVVVQRMVFPDASGIAFTADPVTGNRRVVSIEATFGLGEALVSGRAQADVFSVRDETRVSRTLAIKERAVYALPSGGTTERSVARERQAEPVLTDAQVVRLARLARRIEAHFGYPQDIEWCPVDEDFQVVQSRPITTLFPVPAASDQDNHVYLSVGHQQMMTDPMRPLGLSMWQLTTPAPMREAGGRLFVDVSRHLASPASRASLLDAMKRSDPLMRDALETILNRGDFIPLLLEEDPGEQPPGETAAPIEPDPATVEELIAKTQVSVTALKRDIRTVSGPALFDFILEDLKELKRLLFDPVSHRVIMAGMEAAWWLNDQLGEWLGEKNVADTLSQSVPHNVTSEMGLALLDVADVIRPCPEVVAQLRRVDAGSDGDRFMDDLAGLAGGADARAAIRAWLDRYGMRGVGEIDITRPRWHDRPAALVPILLGHVENFEPGEGARRFERGRKEAEARARELLGRLRGLPDGERKTEDTRQMITRLRTVAGYREYPKYGMVSRYAVYRRALMAEAERLVRTGALGEADDHFYLTFQELREVVRTNVVDDRLVRERRDAFRAYEKLTPPRVITSDGEAIAGSYRRDDLPAGALVGLAVSAGTVEGRARVIMDMAEADLAPGDILVTASTDPSWTPLFITVGGLVTEVGGLMTHGSVIAREYGLPAVVGVERATSLIRDGQRIRVHGTDGFVEILP